jgi:hypothetical protein
MHRFRRSIPFSFFFCSFLSSTSYQYTCSIVPVTIIDTPTCQSIQNFTKMMPISAHAVSIESHAFGSRIFHAVEGAKAIPVHAYIDICRRLRMVFFARVTVLGMIQQHPNTFGPFDHAQFKRESPRAQLTASG